MSDVTSQWRHLPTSLTSTPNVLTAELRDFIFNQCIENTLLLFVFSSPEPLGSWWDYSIGRPLSSVCMYVGWSKCSFLFLIQTKIRILSKLCAIHIDIRYISSNWMLFEKQLWRHSLWHVTSRDIPKGVIVVNRFSRVISAKFEILFRSKMYSIPLRNAHLKLIATFPNTI